MKFTIPNNYLELCRAEPGVGFTTPNDYLGMCRAGPGVGFTTPNDYLGLDCVELDLE